ncbi:response regulator transcription factor [soil metagenome]
MHVVVVSEDARLRGWLGRACAEAGWSVRPLVALAESDPAHAEIDLLLTDARPEEILGEPIQSLLRQGVRVVVVTTRRTDDGAERSLQAGADGHITCPIGTHELTARLRAVSRRPPVVVARSAGPDAVLRVGSLALDPATGRLTVGGSEVVVPGREREAVEMLMLASPYVVSRDELLRRLWRVEPASGSLDVLVRRLRMRLESEEGWRRIESVRGVGFRLLTGPPAAMDLDQQFDQELDLVPLGGMVDDGRRPFTGPPVSGHGPFPFAREGVRP